MHSSGNISQLTQREPFYIHAILAVLQSTAPSASMGLLAQVTIWSTLRASPLVHTNWLQHPTDTWVVSKGVSQIN
jgi:hypothetical protein